MKFDLFLFIIAIALYFHCYLIIKTKSIFYRGLFEIELSLLTTYVISTLFFIFATICLYYSFYKRKQK